MGRATQWVARLSLSSRASAIRGFTSPTAKVPLFLHTYKYFRLINVKGINFFLLTLFNRINLQH